MRFLGRSWPNRHELEDIRQDTYVRVYEAAAKALPLVPKAYLFATARHLMIDRVRRSRVVPIEAIGGLGELEDLNVLIDEPAYETRANAHQELRFLALAFNELPPRCRDVLWLRRVEDLRQKEVGLKLGISEGAVEKALARAILLLARNVLGMGAGGTRDRVDFDAKRCEGLKGGTVHGKRQND